MKPDRREVVAVTTMKATVHERFGSPEVLEQQTVDKPELAPDGVLVRVRAVSVNPVDWYTMAGRPYVGRPMLGLRRPKSIMLGTDFAGTVEAVGSDETDFRVGDEVFGGRSGAFAEYVCVSAGVALKPAGLTFEEAAAVPVAGLTALQGLRDLGQVQPGQHVLINGASGGVGTFAVQIARALGAEVTAVCSTGNVELVRSIGADHVIDYTREDFTRSDQRYDVILDSAGSRGWFALRRVLTPRGTLILVGGPKTSRMFGPLGHVVKVRLAALGSRRKVAFFMAKFNRQDMMVLRDLIDAEKVTPVVDRHYQYADLAQALRYLGEGHARGKVVVTV
jgi:NADPH:quinone reductase-like Zn-dependent oxidoreductase